MRCWPSLKKWKRMKAVVQFYRRTFFTISNSYDMRNECILKQIQSYTRNTFGQNKINKINKIM